MIMIDTGIKKTLATTFKEQGLQFALPRRAIIDLLSGADEYLSAEEIFMRRYITISKASAWLQCIVH